MWNMVRMEYRRNSQIPKLGDHFLRLIYHPSKELSIICPVRTISIQQAPIERVEVDA
jgi:hypothetical protein